MNVIEIAAYIALAFCIVLGVWIYHSEGKENNSSQNTFRQQQLDQQQQIEKLNQQQIQQQFDQQQQQFNDLQNKQQLNDFMNNSNNFQQQQIHDSMNHFNNMF